MVPFDKELPFQKLAFGLLEQGRVILSLFKHSEEAWQLL